MTSELKSGVQSECVEYHRGQNLESRHVHFFSYMITEGVWSHTVARRIETK